MIRVLTGKYFRTVQVFFKDLFVFKKQSTIDSLKIPFSFLLLTSFPISTFNVDYCVCVKPITLCNCLCSSSSSCFSASVIGNIEEFGAKNHQTTKLLIQYTVLETQFPSLKYTTVIEIRKNLQNFNSYPNIGLIISRIEIYFQLEKDYALYISTFYILYECAQVLSSGLRNIYIYTQAITWREQCVDVYIFCFNTMC